MPFSIRPALTRATESLAYLAAPSGSSGRLADIKEVHFLSSLCVDVCLGSGVLACFRAASTNELIDSRNATSASLLNSFRSQFLATRRRTCSFDLVSYIFLRSLTFLRARTF